MTREIKIEEVKLHNNEKSVWMIIHNEVYDVTKFLQEHPGGADSLLDYAGLDGTQGFDDVGHSDDAREMMKQYKIGIVPAEQRTVALCVIPDVAKKKSPSENGNCRRCREKQDSSKPWRNFDGGHPSNRPSRSQTKIKKDTDMMTPERRVQSIMVPRESPPDSSSNSSNLKWALLALAGAIVIGVVLKKYLG